MGGRIPVLAIGFIMLRCQAKPMVFADIRVPQYGDIDHPWVLASAVFGIGWGILGLCPGSAFASVLLDPIVIIPYLIVLALGSLAYERFHR